MGEAYFMKKTVPEYINVGNQPVVIAELELTGGSYAVTAKFDVAPFNPTDPESGLASFTLTFAGVSDKINCTPGFAHNRANNDWDVPTNEAVCLTVAGSAPPQDVVHGVVTPAPTAVLACTLRNQRLRIENITLTAIGVDSIHAVT